MNSAVSFAQPALASFNCILLSQTRLIKQFSSGWSRTPFLEILPFRRPLPARACPPCRSCSSGPTSISRHFSSTAISSAPGTASQALVSPPVEANSTETGSGRFTKIGCGLSRMVATAVDGTRIAKKIRDRLRDKIELMQLEDPTFRPSLTIIQGISIANMSCPLSYFMR